MKSASRIISKLKWNALKIKEKEKSLKGIKSSEMEKM